MNMEENWEIGLKNNKKPSDKRMRMLWMQEICKYWSNNHMDWWGKLKKIIILEKNRNIFLILKMYWEIIAERPLVTKNKDF